jgi:hypothetical protein
VIRRYVAVAPLALAIGLIAAGCGGDSSGETTVPTVSIPAITSPVPTTSSPSVATTTPSTTTSTASTGTRTFNPQAPDSATNDVPPAKGSPEAAFEKQCKQQGTCG